LSPLVLEPQKYSNSAKSHLDMFRTNSAGRSYGSSSTEKDRNFLLDQHRKRCQKAKGNTSNIIYGKKLSRILIVLYTKHWKDTSGQTLKRWRYRLIDAIN